MDNFCFVKLLFVLALAFAFTCAASGQEDSLAYLRPSGSELRIEAAGYGITLGNKDAAVQKPASRTSARIVCMFIYNLFIFSQSHTDVFSSSSHN